jgi:hypothetical protein
MANPLVITQITVFDSLSGSHRLNQTVIISDGRITAVADADTLTMHPQGALVIDGVGKFLIPGLIDAHVHLVHQLKPANMTGSEILPYFLTAGVTSVRDIGDFTLEQAAVAHYAETYPHASPRLFLATDALDGADPFHSDLGTPVAHREQVADLIAKMVGDVEGRRITTVKLYARLTPNVAQEAILEAHRRGMVVAAHLDVYTAQEAIASGVDCLEHVAFSVRNYAFPSAVLATLEGRATLNIADSQCQALIAQIKASDVMVDPTQTVMHNVVLLSDLPGVSNNPDNDRVPSKLRKRWEEFITTYRQNAGQTPQNRELRMAEFERCQELTLELHRAGVRLLVGSDTPEPYLPPGLSLHQEMELLARAGLEPADVLTAATMNNAQSLRMDTELGSVTPGKIADLVILEDDPLVDIRNTRSVHTVIRDGVRVFSLDHRGIIYAIRPAGSLHWYKEENRSGENGPNAQSGWAPNSGSQISFGWQIFDEVMYGGDGIIYAISPAGNLHWYREENRSGGNGPNAQSGWVPGSGSQISFGWQIFRHVFHGGEGIIYAVDRHGRMFWYRDVDRNGGNGAAAQTGWAPGSGSQISFGWEIFQHIFYGGDGIIYAVRPDGRMFWYRDVDRNGGNGAAAQIGWAPGSGSQISFGWHVFRRIFYGGDGIIYAVGHDGRLFWYRDLDRTGGNGPATESGWAPGSGSQISFGWQIFQHVFYGGWDAVTA